MILGVIFCGFVVGQTSIRWPPKNVEQTSPWCNDDLSSNYLRSILTYPISGVPKLGSARAATWCVVLFAKKMWRYCWWFRNPANQLVGTFSHYLQVFMDPRWCRISAINSMKSWIAWLFAAQLDPNMTIMKIFTFLPGGRCDINESSLVENHKHKPRVEKIETVGFPAMQVIVNDFGFSIMFFQKKSGKNKS